MKRVYKGELIKNEPGKNPKSNQLLIRLNSGKTLFCYTTKDFFKHCLKKGKSYVFFDNRKKGDKYYFLTSVKKIENIEKIETKQFQISQLVRQYKIKNLYLLNKRLEKLQNKGDKNSQEYWALLIVKHRKYLTNKPYLSKQEQEEFNKVNFVARNWDLYGFLSL